uniref:Uncharacterized protein n=1 Tax=Panagrolaimus sp. JU765 TaxID=591449 RepID=A0AC34R4Y0_9BILA
MFYSGRVSPPTPPQRRAFSYLLNQNYRPKSGEFENQRTTSPTLSATVTNYRQDFPSTSMSQKSRPKSPSLQNLKNQFKKATNCVRKNQELDDSEFEQEKMRILSTPISQSQSSLYAPINKPKNSSSFTDDVDYDAVEEAIRSLESFDPNKILAEATANRLSKTSGSDSDTPSVVIHPNGKERSSESPSSSGIVADINDELIISQSSLYAPINKPKNPSSFNDDVDYDAVEEAIRSLESFDPNKILAEATANRLSKTSGSDSDTPSVVIHLNGKERSSESPSSSGIVADINDELII